MEEESILKGDLLSERNKLKHRLDSTEASLVECQDQLEDLRKKYFDLEFQMAEQSLEDNDSGVSLNSGGSSQGSLNRSFIHGNIQNFLRKLTSHFFERILIAKCFVFKLCGYSHR